MLKSCAESVAVPEVCRNEVCHGETGGPQSRLNTFASSSGPTCFEKARAPLASHGSLSCAAMSQCLFSRLGHRRLTQASIFVRCNGFVVRPVSAVPSCSCVFDAHCSWYVLWASCERFVNRTKVANLCLTTFA